MNWLPWYTVNLTFFFFEDVSRNQMQNLASFKFELCIWCGNVEMSQQCGSLKCLKHTHLMIGFNWIFNSKYPCTMDCLLWETKQMWQAVPFSTFYSFKLFFFPLLVKANQHSEDDDLHERINTNTNKCCVWMKQTKIALSIIKMV